MAGSQPPTPHAPHTLSAQHVRRIARLSRLAIKDDQVEPYRHALAAVIAYVDRLRGLDLAGVEPLASPLDATARLDDDTPGPTLPTSALMQMAPDTMEPFIKVPKVLGDAGGA